MGVSLGRQDEMSPTQQNVGGDKGDVLYSAFLVLSMRYGVLSP